ncbi:MAG: hypothetical protein CM15mP59_6640 [Flavobacteriaceae bacterium]|nr:MAG: hypothetical protein CM15mP59_6640 [Flavobacteriaceae bacterium]
MRSVQAYHELFSTHLSSLRFEREPIGLYEPISYIMQLGGKRMRPVFALMACEASGRIPFQPLGQLQLWSFFTILPCFMTISWTGQRCAVDSKRFIKMGR